MARRSFFARSSSLFSSLFLRNRRARRRAARVREHRARFAGIENLEPRMLLSTITVTTTDDVIGGEGVSLREAIISMNGNSDIDDDVIDLTFLGASTYNLTIANSAGQENAAAQGDLDINRNVTTQGTLTIRGLGSGSTVINSDVLDRVFHIFGTSPSVNFEDLSIVGGEGLDNGTAGHSFFDSTGTGGGVAIFTGNVTFNQVEISGNWAGYPQFLSPNDEDAIGGGVYAGVASSVKFVDSSVRSNTAWGGFGLSTGSSGPTNGHSAFGGGIYSSGSGLTIMRTVVENNLALGGNGADVGKSTSTSVGYRGGHAGGGGLYITNGSATITDSTFSNNLAEGGEGGQGQDGSTSTFQFSTGTSPSTNFFTTTFTNPADKGGQGGWGYGGGAYAGNNSNLTILRSTFSDNDAFGGEGGQGGQRNPDNSSYTVTGEHGDGGAGWGGGIYIGNNTTTLSLTNSTLSGNNAVGGFGRDFSSNETSFGHTHTPTTSNAGLDGSSYGGGLYVGLNAGSATIQNSTIAENTVGEDFALNGIFSPGIGGGGVFTDNTGTMTVHNSIIALNTKNVNGTITDDDYRGAFDTPRNVLLGVNTGATGITHGVNGNIVGTGAAPVDPLLGFLSDNGGVTETHALLEGSPAIDKGNNSLAPTSTLFIDQAYRPRITDGNSDSTATVDMGSYESNAPDAPVTLTVDGTNEADEICFVLEDGGSTLKVTIQNSQGTTTQYYAFASLSELVVNGLLGDDIFCFDFSGGNPIPGGGETATVNGGGQQSAAGDSLEVFGFDGDGTADFDSIDYVGLTGDTNGNDGTLDLNGGQYGDGLINFTGLEPITVTGTANDMVLTLNAGNNHAVLENVNGAGDGDNRLRDASASVDPADHFETFNFVSPLNTLTINMGLGNDTLDINTLDTTYAAATTANADGGNDLARIGPGGGVTISNTGATGLTLNDFLGGVSLNQATFNGNAENGIVINGADDLVLVDAGGNPVAVAMNTVTANNNDFEGIVINDALGNIGTAAFPAITVNAINNDEIDDAGEAGMRIHNLTGSLFLNSSNFNDTATPGQQDIGLLVTSATGTINLNSVTANGNAGNGIQLGTIDGAVSFTSVTANSNGENGASLVSAPSFRAQAGQFNLNTDHGLTLGAIAGNVTLVVTDFNDNDANDGGVGDGFNADTIGGNLLVAGAQADDGVANTQENGFFIDEVTGTVIFRDSTDADFIPSGSGTNQLVQAIGNSQNGVRINSALSTVTFINGNYNSNGGLGGDTEGDGIDIASVAGTVTLNNVIANSNFKDGATVTGDGLVFPLVDIDGGSYNSNGEDGIDINEMGNVDIDNTQANLNGDDGLEVDFAGTVVAGSGTHNITIDDSTFNNNGAATGTGDGIQITNAEDVTLNGVTANGNDPGLLVNGAVNVTDTDGVYNGNDGDGIRLIDIANDVTLNNTTANDNDADDSGGFPDEFGLAAYDGGDGDGHAIGGDLTVTGGSFSNTAPGGTQDGGITIEPIFGGFGVFGNVVFNGTAPNPINVVNNSFGSIAGGWGVNINVINGFVDFDFGNYSFNAEDGVKLGNILGLTTFDDVNANDNGGDGIQISSAAAIIFNDVTASRNDPGVNIIGAASFSDTNGTYDNNNDDGIRLRNISGAVTLTDTTATDNDDDVNQDGEGLDYDTVAGQLTAGPITIIRGTYSEVDGTQEHGILIRNSEGVSPLVVNIGDADPANFVTANSNQEDGINIFGAAPNGITQVNSSFTVTNENGDFGFDMGNITQVNLNDLTILNNNGDSEGVDGGNLDTVNTVNYTTDTNPATDADVLYLSQNRIDHDGATPLNGGFGSQPIRYTTVSRMAINTTGGEDLIFVEGTGASLDTSINAGIGNDFIRINGDKLSAENFFNGEAGQDEIVLNIAFDLGSNSLFALTGIEINGNDPADDTGARDRVIVNDIEGSIFGVGGDDTDSSVTIDPSTGAASLVGALGINFTNELGLAEDANGTLWLMDENGSIYTVNPSTGAATLVVATTAGFEGLAIPDGQVGFGFSVRESDGTLYSINLTSGAVTAIGAGVGFADVEGLAFAADGTLYAVDDATDQHITISIDTGVGTAVGALGVPAATEQNPGLTFDAAGNLWMSTDEQDGDFYSVDRGSGAATSIGAQGAFDVHGLAVVNGGAGTFARNLTFEYLSHTSGDVDLTGFAIPVNILTTETVMYNGDSADDDEVTIMGLNGVDDLLTVGPTDGTLVDFTLPDGSELAPFADTDDTAFVALGGDPWDGPQDDNDGEPEVPLSSFDADGDKDSYFEHYPGLAGLAPAFGHIGSGPDMLITGMAPTSIYMDGGADDVETGELVFAYVDATGAAASDDAFLTVTDGGTLSESNDDAGPGFNSVVAGAIVSATTTGTLSFEVSNFSGNTMSPYRIYTVVANPTDTAAEVEGNGTALTANPITSTITTGAVAGPDADFFSFTAQAGDRIVVMVDEDPDNDILITDTQLSIIGPDGLTLLASGDNTSSEGANAAGAVIASATGIYYVKITDGGFGTDTDYRFVVQTLPESAQVSEAGGPLLTANQFGLGQILPAGDTDTWTRSQSNQGQGNRLYIYTPNEEDLIDPVAQAANVDIFGFGDGVLLPGFGAGNAYDTITFTDSLVTTTNNSVGPLVNVESNAPSFVQNFPNQDPMTVLNTGFEANGNLPITGGIDAADNITATASPLGILHVNGGDPDKDTSTLDTIGPDGDQLNITPDTPHAKVWSDEGNKTEAPLINIQWIGSVNFPIGFSSIENIAPFQGVHSITIVGDNNNDPANTGQRDYWRLVGIDVDDALMGGDHDGANEVVLTVSTSQDEDPLTDGPDGDGILTNDYTSSPFSIPLSFAGIVEIDYQGLDGIDILEVTPYADNTPLGWGIDVNFDEGAPDQIDGDASPDLLIYNGVTTVSENIALTPSDEEDGTINVTMADSGTTVVIITYTSNLGFIFNGNDGSLGDTDNLFLRGTDGVTSPGTSGAETVFINYDAAGIAADPFITVADTAAGPGFNLYNIHTVTNFDLVHLDLSDGNDSVTITDSDTVSGSADFDATRTDIDPGAGNDSIDASGSTSTRAYTLQGGAGDDSIIGGAGNDSLDGGAGNDNVDGSGGNDTVFGGDGDDTLAGGTGNDFVSGGAGVNQFNFVDGDGDDTLEGNGSDELNLTVASGGSVALSADGSRLQADFGSGDSISAAGVLQANVFTNATGETVTLNPLAATEVTSVNLTLNGTADNVVVNATGANDVIDVTNPGGTVVDVAGLGYDLNIDVLAFSSDTLTVNGLDGDDVIKATAAVAALVLITFNGGAGKDFLSADAVLNGGDDDDTLVGGDGNDTLNGNDGDDVILFSPGGSDNIDGGDGTDLYVLNGTVGDDTININGYSGGSAILNGDEQNFGSFDNMERFEVFGGDGNDDITVNLHSAPGLIDAGAGDDTVDGDSSDENLTILGGAGDDELTGGDDAGASDSIDGGAGNDNLFGGEGADILVGGDGADVLAGEEGVDQLFGGADSDTFNVSGATDGADVIEGGSGDVDVLNYTDIAFTASAVSGRLVVDNVSAADIEVLNVTGVTDASFVNFLGGTGIQDVNITLGGATVPTVIHGSEVADNLNVMTSSTGASVRGLGYDVDISGADFADTIFLLTNGGNDYVVAFEDAVGMQLGIDLGAGDDYLDGSTSTGPFNAAGGAGNDTLIGGFAGDILDGGADNDFVDGGPGADVLLGGTGDDILIDSPGFDQFDGTSGFDTVVLNGTNGDDTLTSPSTDSYTNIDLVVINGLDGNDTINVSHTAVPVQINAGIGNDTVNAGGTTVATTIDGGNGNDSLTGGTVVDYMTGGQGRDTFVGGTGADLMFGGDDFDTFTWNSGDGADVIDGGSDEGDIFNFNGSAGADTISITPNAINPTHLNIAVGGGPTVDLHGVEEINVDALAGADGVLVGDLSPTEVKSLDVVLGADNDTLQLDLTQGHDVLGLSGDDTISVTGLNHAMTIIGSTSDTLTVNALAGDDELKAEPGVESGIAIVFNGNDGDDFLSADATLNGGNGNDTLEGGDGADFMTGGDGDDLFLFNANAFVGTDTMDGGAGFDILLTEGGEGADFIVVTQTGISVGNTSENLSLISIDRFDVYGNGGDDTLEITLTGGVGALVYGGTGNDAVQGGGSTAPLTVFGGAGDDNLTGGSNSDDISGEDGADFITGGEGSDNLFGGADGDFFEWNSGDSFDVIDGGDDQADIFQINGSSGTDSFLLRSNDDGTELLVDYTVSGDTATHIVRGVEEVDVNFLSGTSDNINIDDLTQTEVNAVDINLGSDGDTDFVTVHGRTTDDNLLFTSDDGLAVKGLAYDVTMNNEDNDQLQIIGHEGNDRIESVSGTMHQIFRGNDGNDTLIGAGSDDELFGNDGDDLLIGGSSNDELFGGDGRDTLDGGDGDDEMLGGSDDDLFLFSNASGNTDTYGGEGGFDVIRVEGNEASNNFSVGVFSSGVGFVSSGLESATINVSDVERMDLVGNGGDDNFEINPNANFVITADGGAPIASDDVTVFGTNSDDSILFVPTSQDSATVTVGELQPVHVSTMENLTIDGLSGDSDGDEDTLVVTTPDNLGNNNFPNNDSLFTINAAQGSSDATDSGIVQVDNYLGAAFQNLGVDTDDTEGNAISIIGGRGDDKVIYNGTSLADDFNINDATGRTDLSNADGIHIPVFTEGVEFLEVKGRNGNDNLIVDPNPDTGGGAVAGHSGPGSGSGFVLLDGGDRDDHGSFNGTDNVDGWLYIQNLIEIALVGSNNGAPNDLLVLSTGDSGFEAVQSAGNELGFTTTGIAGADISTVDFAQYKLVFVPSSDYFSNSDNDLLALRSADLADAVDNHGVNLIGLTSSGHTNPLAWVPVAVPFVTSFDTNDNQYRTPEGIAAGLTLSDQDLIDGTPIHTSFTGPPGFNGLQVLVRDYGDNNIQGDSDDRVIALGFGAGSGGFSGGVFEYVSITLDGGLNNDVLAGGAGVEYLNGGVGDDTYVFGLEGRDIGNDHVTDASGGGSDTFDFSEAESGIRIDMDLQDVNQGVRFGDTISIHGLIENFIGSQSNDLIYIDATNEPRSVEGNDPEFGPGAADTLRVDVQNEPAIVDGNSNLPGVQPFVIGGPGTIQTGAFNTFGLISYTEIERLFIENEAGSDGTIGKEDFSVPVIYRVGKRPKAVATGDFNGDGFTDIVVANNGSASVNILTNLGDGTFRVSAQISLKDKANGIKAIRPVSAVVADFDGDGDLDIAVNNIASKNIIIIRNTGDTDGTTGEAIFEHAGEIFVGRQSVGMDVGDVDGDGTPDLIVGKLIKKAHRLGIILNNNGGSDIEGDDFTPKDLFPAGGLHTTAVKLADMDEDGDLDIIAANTGADRVTVLLNADTDADSDGIPDFTIHQQIAVRNAPKDIIVGDFNSDGILDVAAIDNARVVITMLLGEGDGEGTLRLGPSQQLIPNRFGIAIDAEDMNGDGFLDLVTSSDQGNRIDIVMGLGNGTFRPPITFRNLDDIGVRGPEALALADLNNDGTMDIVSAGFRRNQVHVILRNLHV